MTTPYGQDPVPGSDPQYSQSPYGQPGYGQAGDPTYGQPAEPGYGQPGARNAALANAYGSPISSGAKFGVVGATFAGIGGVLLIIAFTAVDWISQGGSSTFSDIHDALKANPAGASGVATTYFSWLGWVLLIVVIVVAIAATLPTPASGPLRALGAVIAAAAIALTFFALQISDGVAYSSVIKHASIGFYLAVGGFLLAGIGALIGPSNRV
jgi:hypothetical protein